MPELRRGFNLTALGASGGALGYGGIINSVAVMFDLYSGGSHASTTKLLLNGSTDKTGAIDMGPFGIALGNGDPLGIGITYDGASTITETVMDTVTGAVFSHAYTLTMTLAQIIGGPAAYAGFTGGTGGETAFTTTFTFRQLPGSNPLADGMAFVLQADPRGAHALDTNGGGLGYGPDTPGAMDANAIVHSIAIKLDLYSNAGEGINSTDIFSGGRSPTVRDPSLPATPDPLHPDQSIDLTGSAIDLHSGHTFQVTLTYNGTTLTETILDTVTNATFSHDYRDAANRFPEGSRPPPRHTSEPRKSRCRRRGDQPRRGRFTLLR